VRIGLVPPRAGENFLAELKDPEDFLLVWEHAILPLLAELVMKLLGSYQSIGLRRGRRPYSRTINVMTTEETTAAQRTSIRTHTMDVLPPNYHDKTNLVFQSGKIEKSSESEDLELDSKRAKPRNPYY
jgi:hypothetical protein